MKKTSALVLIASFLVFASDYYRIDGVKKIQKDLYGNNRVLLVTKYCYHYTYGESVVLKWDGFSGEIIWEDNTTCQCENIIKR